MDSFSGSLCRFPREGRLEGHGSTVLGFPCPRRSCSGQMLRPERLRTIRICTSVSTVMLCCKAVYGGTLWRPALILEFARLVQQSLGTSALFLSYVLVDTIYRG
jgi:hypothetical protein